MAMGVAGLLVSSCGDFTDIMPKGESLLESTDELELLLNTDAYGNYSHIVDYIMLGSNSVYSFYNVPGMINVENKSARMTVWCYLDDQDNLNRLASMTQTDGIYSTSYNLIGTIANPILTKLETTGGSDAVKNALRAEALVIRAYAHFHVVQKFAPAYNGTNGEEPAIIYMTEDKDILVPQEKNTLQECYDMMLKDVDDALALNALPNEPMNYMRWSKPAALALKAHIQLNLRQYAEAEATAKQVLGINNQLYDYWDHAVDGESHAADPAKVLHYKYIELDDRTNPETLFLTPDVNYYRWTSPTEWNTLEENYGLRGLGNTMGRQYYGFVDYGIDYSDIGALQAGLPGWDSLYDFDNYRNFLGLDVPQMYLIIAEAELQQNHIGTAMEWLDLLRDKRLPAGYEKLQGTVTGKADAIEWLEKTARAEYYNKGWAFYARKRWNTFPEWARTQTHTIDGKTYTLRPDSKLWIFPFPLNATERNPNLTNNW